MLSAARGLTDPLACDPVPDLVGPSGFKINDGRVSGLPQGFSLAETPCPKSKAEVIGSTPRQRFVPPQGSPLRPRLDIHSIAFWRYFGSHSTATR